MNDYKFPIRVHFDPFADPELAKIFKHPRARTLYLLWRTEHIVGDDFIPYVWSVVNQAEYINPATPEQMFQCFFRNNAFLHPYWVRKDVEEFCHRAWPFLSGKQEVTWELVQKENQ